MAESVEERLKKLTTKVDELKTKKIRAEQELELKRQEHTNLIKELQDIGIQNIDDLPNVILQLEEEFNQQLTNAEKNVEEIERATSSF